MSELGQQLIQQALSLPAEERAALAETLLESLDSPETKRIEALWVAEAERRVVAYRRGEIETIPAEEVFRSLQK